MTSAEDAATEAPHNNEGVHNSADTVIASIIEDILDEEGKKSTDPHATEDPAEPESEDVPIVPWRRSTKGNPRLRALRTCPKRTHFWSR